MKKLLLMIVLCAVAAAGCAKKEPPAPAPPETALLIGLIPERNIFKQIERYEPLADYLSKKVGVKIKLKVLTLYGNIIDNFEAGKLDGAFFGSFTYSLAHAKLGVDVLARPEDLTGRSMYHGYIFVRKDSGIRSVREMKGKRLALVARATTAGYLFPLIYLQRAGINELDAYFREVYYTGTHEGTVQDVLDGKADVGVSKNSVYRILADADPRIDRELAILARSDDVPENALALRKNIEDSVKTKLLDSLITMHSDPEGAKVLKTFGARRFIETTDADYKPVLAYARERRIDLARCDFSND
jgi:phosphonate transport system substrate-binding protein